MSRNTGRLATIALAACALACRRDMQDQPKLRGLRGSEFFADGRSARPPIPDTVPRTGLRDDDAYFTGKVAGRFVDTFPAPVTRTLLVRGHERFDIYCSPCHGLRGDGRGMVVRRGLLEPASFHIDRLRQAAPGYFYDVITHGFGKMQDYAASIAPADRWAIVSYIRALQLSQDAPLTDVPPAERARLDEDRP